MIPHGGSAKSGFPRICLVKNEFPLEKISDIGPLQELDESGSHMGKDNTRREKTRKDKAIFVSENGPI